MLQDCKHMNGADIFTEQQKMCLWDAQGHITCLDRQPSKAADTKQKKEGFADEIVLDWMDIKDIHPPNPTKKVIKLTA